MVSGLKGAAVTFSDFQPRALEICGLNARLHRLSGFRLRLEDWRTFFCRERFNLVLASDIAYEPRLLPYLKAVLLRVIKPGGSILISHPGRLVTRRFIGALLSTGLFSAEYTVIPVTVKDDPVRTCYDISINKLICEPV